MRVSGSVPLGGFIAPLDEADSYPVMDPVWGLGSLRTVQSIVERNAITTARREEGMIVYVIDNETYYGLESPLTNADWAPLPMTGSLIESGESGDILVYGYGYDGWGSVDADDYFYALGYAKEHTDLNDMPDTLGINTDHDVRLVAKVQDSEPVIPAPFAGMFWYDTDEDATYYIPITDPEITEDTSLTLDNVVILANGTLTLTLSSTTNIKGKLFRIKNIGTGIITVDPEGTTTIDGGLTAIIENQYESITIISNGSNWYIV